MLLGGENSKGIGDAIAAGTTDVAKKKISPTRRAFSISNLTTVEPQQLKTGGPSVEHAHAVARSSSLFAFAGSIFVDGRLIFFGERRNFCVTRRHFCVK